MSITIGITLTFGRAAILNRHLKNFRRRAILELTEVEWMESILIPPIDTFKDSIYGGKI